VLNLTGFGAFRASAIMRKPERKPGLYAKCDHISTRSYSIIYASTRFELLIARDEGLPARVGCIHGGAGVTAPQTSGEQEEEAGQGISCLYQRHERGQSRGDLRSILRPPPFQ
jgi:hypothetical protein